MGEFISGVLRVGDPRAEVLVILPPAPFLTILRLRGLLLDGVLENVRDHRVHLHSRLLP